MKAGKRTEKEKKTCSCKRIPGLRPIRIDLGFPKYSVSPMSPYNTQGLGHEIDKFLEKR